MEQIFKPSVIWDSILAIIPSIPTTMAITVVSGVLGLLFGFVLAVIRIRKIPVLASAGHSVYFLYQRNAAAGTAVSVLLREYRCC